MTPWYYRVCLFFLQPFLLAEFFYFGLRFGYLKTRIAFSRKSIPFSLFSSEIQDSRVIQVAIQDDVRDMNNGLVGGKCGYTPNGTFVKLDKLDESVYVYQHTNHATCSGTKLSQLETCEFSLNRVERGILACETKDHYALMPFFMGNAAVLMQYEDLKSKDDSLFKLGEVEELVKIVRDGKDCLNTPYTAPLSLPNNWIENEWTQRLVPGIQRLFPNMNVTYTAEMGLSWHTVLVQRHLRAELSRERHFLFRGSPDIVINRIIAVSLQGASQVDNTESSDEDSLVENSRQPHPMQADDKFDPTEKIGEVFGGLYVLLVSKILRKIRKGKAVHRNFVVKGLLVDKARGGDRCILRVDFKDGISDLVFDVTTIDTYLGPDTLCPLLHLLLN